jgi:hypothetical protein
VVKAFGTVREPGLTGPDNRIFPKGLPANFLAGPCNNFSRLCSVCILFRGRLPGELCPIGVKQCFTLPRAMPTLGVGM